MTVGEYIRQQGNEALALFAVSMMEVAEQKLIETNGLQDLLDVAQIPELRKQNVETMLEILNQPYQEE